MVSGMDRDGDCFGWLNTEQGPAAGLLPCITYLFPAVIRIRAEDIVTTDSQILRSPVSIYSSSECPVFFEARV